MQSQPASAILCTKLYIIFEKLFLWCVKIEFFLDLALILACIVMILLSVTLLMSVPFGMYRLTSLLMFSTAPFCHDAYESVKYTYTPIPPLRRSSQLMVDSLAPIDCAIIFCVLPFVCPEPSFRCYIPL